MLQYNNLFMAICYGLKVIAFILFDIRTFSLEKVKKDGYRRQKQPLTAWWRAA